MSLVKCPECGKEVSDTAIACPHCGYAVAEHFKNNVVEEKENKTQDETAVEKKVSKSKELSKKQIAIIGTIIVAVIALLIGFGNYKSKEDNYKYFCELSNEIVGKLDYVDQNFITILDANNVDIGDGNAKVLWRIIASEECGVNELFDDETDVFASCHYAVSLDDYKELNHYCIATSAFYARQSDKRKKRYNEYMQKYYGTTYDEIMNRFASYSIVDTPMTDEELQNLLDEHRLEKIKEWNEQDSEEQEKNKNKPKEEVEVVSVVSLDHETLSDYYVITGSVKNTTKKTVYYVQVKISLLDSSGKVIDTESTYAVGSEGLAPGESSTFSCYVDKISGTSKFTARVYDYQ
ncbi:MAG: zinc-ribbon domain-containing protein [Butyrivibrio sp.]|nr:zinc-ribbon domain-containing protein [Butyrivibrio sp.]